MIGVATTSLIALAVAVAVFGTVPTGGPARARSVSRVAEGAAPRPVAPFAWLHPGPAPPGWVAMTTPSGQATLFRPPGWTPIPGDPGTVSAALRGDRGAYLGYLNVTPREGVEHSRDWARFRLNRNRDEGDRHVRQLAVAEALRFRAARGACLIDDYSSRVGAHPYREIACLVTGRRHADVFVAAALRGDWAAERGSLERAASAFAQR